MVVSGHRPLLMVQLRKYVNQLGRSLFGLRCNVAKTRGEIVVGDKADNCDQDSRGRSVERLANTGQYRIAVAAVLLNRDGVERADHTYEGSEQAEQRRNGC